MSKDIAKAFIDNYPNSPLFNCSNISNLDRVKFPYEYMWLSWGNSWMSKHCNWKDVLQSHLNFTILIPTFKCFHFIIQLKPNDYINPSNVDRSAGRPCAEDQELFLITHHQKAAHLILSPYKYKQRNISSQINTFSNQKELDQNKLKLYHLCEHLLLIDKIKDPEEMQHIYQHATANHYYNYSSVFLHDGDEGWAEVVRRYDSDDKQCRRQWESNDPMQPVDGVCARFEYPHGRSLYRSGNGSASARLAARSNRSRILTSNGSSATPLKDYFSFRDFYQ